MEFKKLLKLGQIPEAVGLLLQCITSAVLLLDSKGEVLFGGDNYPFIINLDTPPESLNVVTGDIDSRTIKETAWLDCIKSFINERSILFRLIE